MTMVLPAGMSGRPGFGTMILPRGMGAWGQPTGGEGVAYRAPHVFSRRSRGLGQHWYSGIVNAAENIAGGLPVNAPEAGGGYVTAATANADNSQTIRYVDSSGNAGIMTVSANPDGSTPSPDQLQAAVNATGAGTTPPIIPPALQIPPWVPWAVGGVFVLLLLGYSGAGRVVFRGNPLLSVFGNPPHRRRHGTRRRRRSRKARR
jgi:hypothetical protein